MIATFTARFTKIDSGYMGELIEWPEVITEGTDLEDCRNMLEDALHEMVMAYHENGKEIPSVKAFFINKIHIISFCLSLFVSHL